MDCLPSQDGYIFYKPLTPFRDEGSMSKSTPAIAAFDIHGCPRGPLVKEGDARQPAGGATDNRVCRASVAGAAGHRPHRSLGLRPRLVSPLLFRRAEARADTCRWETSEITRPSLPGP